MLGPLALYQISVDQHMFWIDVLLIVFGFICAWTWWSVNVTLWRHWATRRGVDPGELQWRGEEANILWPEGHFFERTEAGHVIERLRGRKGTKNN